MTDRDPSKRITLDQVEEHPWLTNGERLPTGALTKELEKRAIVVAKINECNEIVEAINKEVKAKDRDSDQNFPTGSLES